MSVRGELGVKYELFIPRTVGTRKSPRRIVLPADFAGVGVEKGLKHFKEPDRNHLNTSWRKSMMPHATQDSL